MQPRILILCDAFTPPAFVPRVRMLATNLQNMGWQVSVATEAMPNVNFSTTDFELIQIPYYTSDRGWKWLIKWLADQLFNCKEKHFHYQVKQTIGNYNYDIVLCSSFNLFPLHTAVRLAQESDVPLVADLRDIAEQWGKTSYSYHSLSPKWLGTIVNRLYKWRTIKRRNRLLKKVSAITTISTWHQAFLKQINQDTHLIYNGFDNKQFVPKDIPTSKFIISYTGRIYNLQFRNPELLFKALSSLINKGLIVQSDIVLQFHIEKTAEEHLYDLVSRYKLQSILNVEGFISQDDTIKLLQQSSICLILTNKTTEQGPFGIMTTKFFEALGVEKPVLCVRSDESVLEEAIKNTNAGIAARTAEEVEQFILDKYHEWQEHGFTHQQVRNKELFTRQYQAEQFAALFDSLIKK